MSVRPALYFSLCLLLLGVVGCGRVFTEQEEEIEGDIAVDVEEPFELHFEQTAFLGEDLTIYFADVVEETRCPPTLNCQENGRAVIELHVTRTGGSREVLRLLIAGLAPSPHLHNTSRQFGNHLFTLFQVDPYPTTSAAPGSYKDYTAVIKIDSVQRP
jgi:hypothetical protein